MEGLDAENEEILPDFQQLVMKSKTESYSKETSLLDEMQQIPRNPSSSSLIEELIMESVSQIDKQIEMNVAASSLQKSSKTQISKFCNKIYQILCKLFLQKDSFVFIEHYLKTLKLLNFL